MKNLKKSTVLKILIMLCVILLCACSSNDKKDDTNPSGSSDTNSNGTAEEILTRPPTLPKDLKFTGQTIKIYNFFGEDSLETTLAQSANIVEDALYKKNMKVLANLGIDMQVGYPTPKDWSPDGNAMEVTRLMMADDFDYDFIIGGQYQVAYLTGREYLTNLHNLPYVDIERPWWAKKYIDEITVGNNTRFFLAGDICLEFVQYLSTMFYNKNLYANLFGGNPDELYDVVLAGDWTIDMLIELSKNTYSNLDGTGKADLKNDRFGVFVQRIAVADQFFYPMHPRVTLRDSEGLPYVNLGDPHSISALEKLRELYDNNIGALDMTGSDMNWSEEFMSGRILFMSSCAISAAQDLTNMAQDYGIIPMPKFDKNQTEYLAMAHDATPIICVPSNSTNYDLIGAVLEEMAYWSYTDVTPTYFNEALRFRYSRDESDVASYMVDLIRNGATTDFGYVYGLLIVGKLNDFNNNGLGYVQRYLTRNPRTGIASYIEKGTAVWETKLAELVDLYVE